MCGARLTSFTPRVEDFSDRMSAGTSVFLLFRYGDGDGMQKSFRRQRYVSAGTGDCCLRSVLVNDDGARLDQIEDQILDLRA